MRSQRPRDGALSPPLAESEAATDADVDSEHRLQTLEVRVERLEKELEGLQDALYRHQVLQDRKNNDSSRRTEQIARGLRRDARGRLP